MSPNEFDLIEDVCSVLAAKAFSVKIRNETAYISKKTLALLTSSFFLLLFAFYNLLIGIESGRTGVILTGYFTMVLSVGINMAIGIWNWG